MDERLLAEIFRDMVEDPAWEPGEDFTEFDGALARTFVDAGLRGVGFVVYLPDIDREFRFTIETSP